MARKPRLIVPGWPLHVVQRGHDRQPVFFCDDDYWKYLNDLKRASIESGCEIHAYVLMTNHIHLLMTPVEEKSASELMIAMGRRYVRYVNGKYRRSGTLWEGRYKSCLIDSDTHLLGVSRYIELNPVRAKMVGSAHQYPWSSLHHNALGKSNDLVTEHRTYIGLAQTKDQRLAAYRELFADGISDEEIAFLREGMFSKGFVGNDWQANKSK